MEENTNSNDKSKVIMLVSLIIVVSILIVGFVFLAVIDLTRKDAASRLKTTTRRTVVTNNQEEEPVTEPALEEPTEEPTTQVPTQSTTTAGTTTTRRQTTNGVTSTKIITEEYEYTETVIPSHTYEIANDSSTYPDALDSWEWNIVDRINKTRKESGMSELSVARELRDKAEEAAYIYYANGADALKKYLEGHSYLYMYSNLNITPDTLYDNTVSSTKVVTNPNLQYVGAGVLLKNTSLDTYFYVIIYE